jgi:hypothetical protein
MARLTRRTWRLGIDDMAADLMTDRAGADVQLGRRLGQAQMTRGGLESPQPVQGRQSMHEIISFIG